MVPLHEIVEVRRRAFNSLSAFDGRLTLMLTPPRRERSAVSDAVCQARPGSARDGTDGLVDRGVLSCFMTLIILRLSYTLML